MSTRRLRTLEDIVTLQEKAIDALTQANAALQMALQALQYARKEMGTPIQLPGMIPISDKPLPGMIPISDKPQWYDPVVPGIGTTQPSYPNPYPNIGGSPKLQPAQFIKMKNPGALEPPVWMNNKYVLMGMDLESVDWKSLPALKNPLPMAEGSQQDFYGQHKQTGQYVNATGGNGQYTDGAASGADQSTGSAGTPVAISSGGIQ